MAASFKNVPFIYQEDTLDIERNENKENPLDAPSTTSDNGEKKYNIKVRGFVSGFDAEAEFHALSATQNGEPGELIFPNGNVIEATLKRVQRTRAVTSALLIKFELEFSKYKLIKVPIITATHREKTVDANEKAKAATDKKMGEIADDIAKKPSHFIDFITEETQNFLDKAESVKDFADNPLQGKFGTLLGSGIATAGRFRQLFTPITGWDASTINALIDGFRLTPKGVSSDASSGRNQTPSEAGVVDAIESIILQAQAQAITEILTAPDAVIAGGAGEIADMRVNLLTLFRAEARKETGALSETLSTTARAVGIYFAEEIERYTVLENYSPTTNEAIRPFCFKRYATGWRNAMVLINSANKFQQYGVLKTGVIYQIPVQGF